MIQGEHDQDNARTDEEEDQDHYQKGTDEDDQYEMQAPGGADEEEYDQEDQQMINPHYQLEDYAERDQDGNLIQHSLNVNTHNA